MFNETTSIIGEGILLEVGNPQPDETTCVFVKCVTMTMLQTLCKEKQALSPHSVR